jgi:threonylcarbamoyladenosine tRNA methylthiotransferase MtaB
MNRRHKRQEVIEFCDEIKKYKKNIGIGADLIAGFPTETEEMHKNSCRLIEEIELVFGHIFPYSIRENTPAAVMEQVHMEIRRNRAKELRKIADFQLKNFKEKQLKLPQKILIETENVGRTENYLSVELPKNILKEYKIGDIILK